MTRFRVPEPLAAHHDLRTFDCGVPSLNHWLVSHARQAARAGSARTFVVHDAKQDRIVGYHAIAGASLTHEDAIRRAAKGIPRHPLPAALLARLAVDTSVQGRGLGAWLLGDAMRRVLGAAESIGIRVMLVHAVDETARAFYERHGFERSPTDSLNLQILLKDVRASMDAAAPPAMDPEQLRADIDDLIDPSL